MDLALAVEYLMGEADYRSAATYEALAATWRDARPLPTEAALRAAWEARQSAEKEAEAARLRREAARAELEPVVKAFDLSKTRTQQEVAQAVNYLLARLLE